MTTPKDNKKSRNADRHKPGRQIRVRGAYLAALDALAMRNGTSPPEETNRAVREMLQREGLWPPPEPAPKAERRTKS